MSSSASEDSRTYGKFADDESHDLCKINTPIESLQVQDSASQWTVSQESNLVRKLDKGICVWCCLTVFALALDKGNHSQANSDDMLKDIGISTNDYNTGQTIFSACFLLAELPSQMLAKQVGPHKWIPLQVICWSIVASCQSVLSNRSSYFACRALLGIFEGGFIPVTILYLSYWYTSRELPIRLSILSSAGAITAIIAAFLSLGILHMRGIRGLEGWRWLFVLEGALTIIIGIFTLFCLPSSPAQTATLFRKAWFTKDEEQILINRILRDDPSKGDIYSRQMINPKTIWACFKEYDLWPMYLIGLSYAIPGQPIHQYMTILLKDLNFTTFQTNLLTIPAAVITIVNLLSMTWLSERINQRIIFGMLEQLWSLPLLVALELLPANANRWARWAISTLLIASPPVGSILAGLTSRNAGSVRTRAVSAAFYNMCVTVSHMIGSNIYRENDKPLYRSGNKILLGILAYNFFVFGGAKLYYVLTNRYIADATLGGVRKRGMQ